MTWHATFLMIDLFLVFACAALLWGAPGFWQRSVLCWYGAGFLVLAVGRVCGLAGEEHAAQLVLNVGRIFIVVGVMAHVFRLFIAEEEILAADPEVVAFENGAAHAFRSP